MSANLQLAGPAIKLKWNYCARLAAVCCLLSFLFFTPALSAAGDPRQTAPAASSDDLVVVEVMPNSRADKAGLRADDVLLTYAGRPLPSTFAFLAAAENCFAPAGMTVKAKRGGQAMEFTMPADGNSESGLIVRPALAPEIQSLFVAGLKEFDAKKWEAANAKWRLAFEAAEATGSKQTSAWLCGWLATGCLKAAHTEDDSETMTALLFRARNFMEAQTWIQRAWERVKDSSDTAAQANVLTGLGVVSLNLGNIDAAFPWFEQAHTLAVQDGNEAWAATARDLQGLILLSRHTPDSPSYRSGVTTVKAELAQARSFCRDALEIRRRIMPASVPFADSLRNMGSIATVQGDLEDAQLYCEQVIALYRQTRANPMQMFQELVGLGVITELRGDIVASQRANRAALELLTGNDIPSQQKRCSVLNNMALMSAMQGDLDQAEQYAQQALAACPNTNSGHLPQKALVLTTLGLVSVARHDLPTARRDCEQALALWRQKAVILNGKAALSVIRTGEAGVLNTLGMIATIENQLPQARQDFQQARDIWQDTLRSPAGLATSLNGLGMAAARAGDLAEAQAKFQAARDILRADTTVIAADPTAAANLGRVYLLRNQPDRALPLLEEAVTILEERRQRVPSMETRALFMQLYANPLADLIQAYLALNRRDKAFATLERLHARTFADSLAAWRLQLDRNLPAPLKARQQELDNLRRIREKDVLRARGGGNAREAAAQAALEQCAAQQRQAEADARQDYVRRIGHDIAYPAPIALPAAQRSLPNGVLALAYAVDDDSARLFALTNSYCHVYTLPLSRTLVAQRVQKARGLITDIHSTLPMVAGVMTKLYDDLLRPAQADIDDAQSLVICPDGALNLLPFAALMPDGKRFLIQNKPITLAASLTIYHSLRADARPILTSLLALGDPAYAGAATSGRTAGPRPEAAPLGAAWPRLPETGVLAQQIKALYAPDSTLLLKEQASAANLLAQSVQAGIVHLGCHAVSDSQNAFGSWLALAPAPNDDTGRLAAWQILRLRLNARLVVLWGCGTGLGKERVYEGVEGLTRAFQCAGARSVLTTLWEVQPKETAPLLLDFYRSCKAGAPRPALASALRAAQIKAIKTDPKPYFWAAFALNGSGE